MRLIIQRVKRASVSVVGKNTVVGKIQKGLFVLVGVKKGDTEKDAELLANKLFKLRVMSDPQDKMNLSVADVHGEFLLVSQFTLYADTTGGNRPSFVDAALPEEAEKIYSYFVDKVKLLGGKVQTGSFGKYMKIDTELDGPVTIILES
ncbi:D-tyrosyl-tRNA(Tyr) deacylase [Candidatus Woesebacteria bacterium]|nr:D-tyrosyl-tRNA(Tyr) deacylase [Candidatus Woesebacteria bacterium]